MARNVALFGRREMQAHRRFVSGVTATVPRYQDVDGDGNKEWVVDVYLGPLDAVEVNIVKDVPIAPYARVLVSDMKLPVTMERSKQGKYTVIGRTKTYAAGVMGADGDIDEPTYHQVTHNLADLRVRHIADLDYVLETLQVTPSTQLQADPDEPLQVVRAYDAFGNQVIGPEADDEPSLVAIAAEEVVETRHLRIMMAKLGPNGDPLAMDWGVSVLQPSVQEVVTSP